MLFEEVLHLDLGGVLVVVHVGKEGGVIVLGQGSKLILERGMMLILVNRYSQEKLKEGS